MLNLVPLKLDSCLRAAYLEVLLWIESSELKYWAGAVASI